MLRIVITLLALGAASPATADTFAVVDGDTIKNSEATFRLFGIDAPEAGQLCAAAGGGTWHCGRAAIRQLEEFMEGRRINCDNRGHDEYGRILSVCHAAGIELNAAMIKQGLAWSFRRYAHDYDLLEDQVRSTRVGIWQAKTETPWDYRLKRWEIARQAAPDGCPIKGNINSDGERIYHAPWSPWYDRTKVSVEKGERWFCDEGEAVAAGWRAPFWGR